jgi:Spy/CpxP family protein refolding chaperone
MKIRSKWLLVGLAVAGLSGAALGQTSSGSGAAGGSTAGNPPHARHWHRGGNMIAGGLLRALRQLNLTAEQQASVKTILSTARQQAIAARKASGRPDFAVLANPGDPSYAAALQALQSSAAQRIQQESQVELQLYDVLTPTQKTQLPQVLANMKARMAARQGRAA